MTVLVERVLLPFGPWFTQRAFRWPPFGVAGGALTEVLRCGVDDSLSELVFTFTNTLGGQFALTAVYGVTCVVIGL